MNALKNRAYYTAASRARRRAQGLTAIEAVLHRDEIASLDQFKARLGVASRSEVIRLLIAKADASTLTPADTLLLSKSVG